MPIPDRNNITEIFNPTVGRDNQSVVPGDVNLPSQQTTRFFEDPMDLTTSDPRLLVPKWNTTSATHGQAGSTPVVIAQHVNKRLIDIVIDIQVHLGYQITITSGLRQRGSGVNETIGGSYDSAHYRGLAIDLDPPSDKVKEVMEALSLYAKEITFAYHNGDHIHVALKTYDSGTAVLYPDENFQPIVDTPTGVYFSSKTAGVGPKQYTVVGAEQLSQQQGYNEEKSDKPGAFKIGCTWLDVPPTSIEVSEMNNVFRIPTVRTAGSPYTRDGRASIVIDFDCIFHDLQSANDQLRHVIAQFRRCPFLPIENYFLQSILYPDVKPAESAPPIPVEPKTESLSEELSYSNEEHLAEDTWLKRKKTLEDAISSYSPGNVDAVIKEIEQRGRAVGVESETEFRRRVELLKQIPRYLSKYMQIRSSLSGISYEDQQIVCSLREIVVSTMPGYPQSLKAHFTCDLFNYLPYTNTFAFIEDVGKENIPVFNASKSNVFQNYYRGLLTVGGGRPEFPDSVPSINTKLEALRGKSSKIKLQYVFTSEQKKNVLGSLASISKYLEAASQTRVTERGNVEVAQELVQNIYDFLTSPLFSGWRKVQADVYDKLGDYISNYAGSIPDLVRSIQHVWVIKDQFLDENIYVLGDKNNLDRANRMHDIFITRTNKVGAPIIQSLSEYLAEIQLEGGAASLAELKTIAKHIVRSDVLSLDTSFDSVTLGDSTIEESSVITGLSAAYKPNIVPVALEAYTSPTFQYMGASEWVISLNIQTTSPSLIQKLRLMNERMNRLELIKSKGSPFVNIMYLDNTARVMEGELLHFLGIGKVMPGNFRFSTVEGSPGTYNISIDLIQTDLTITQYERLVSDRQFSRSLLSSVLDKMFTSDLSTLISTASFDITVDIRNNDHVAIQEWRSGTRSWGTQGDPIGSNFNPEKSRRWNKLIYNLAKPIPNFLLPGDTPPDTVLNYFRKKLRSIIDPTLRSDPVESRRKVYVKRVIDGDTFITTTGERIRLAGLNAFGTDEARYDYSEVLGPRAAAWLTETIEGQSVYVENVGVDKHGRTLAWSYIDPNSNVSIDEYIVNLGLGTPWYGAARKHTIKTIAESGYLIAITLLIQDLLMDALLNDEIPAVVSEALGPELIDQIRQSHKIFREANSTYPDLDLPSFAGSPDFFFFKPDFYDIDVVESDAMALANVTKDVSEKMALLNMVNKYGAATLPNHRIDQTFDAIDALISEERLRALVDTSQKSVSSEIDLSTKVLLGLENGTVNYRNPGDAIAVEARKRIEKEKLGGLEKQLGILNYVLPQTDNGNLDLARSLAKSWGIITEEEREMNRDILLDALKLREDKTLRLARAFPTFKLYFIEKDKAEWILFDDLYSYAAVKSIRVNSSRERASSTAVIELSNISNVLTDIKTTPMENPLLGGTVEEQNVDRIMIRPGAEIMVRMGYSTNPGELPIVFQGAITSITPGEILVLEAQGWGAELLNPAAPGAPIKIAPNVSTIKEFGDLVSAIINQVPGMNHFGSSYNLAEMIDVAIPENAYNEIRATYWTRVINRGFKYAGFGPAIDHRLDNIYLPYHSVPGIGITSLFREILGGKGLGFEWYLDSGKPAWDCIKDVLRYFPSYIMKVLPYNENDSRRSRTTLYIGPPDGYYKATDDSEYVPSLIQNEFSKYIQRKRAWQSNINTQIFSNENDLKKYLISKGWNFDKEVFQDAYTKLLVHENGYGYYLKFKNNNTVLYFKMSGYDPRRVGRLDKTWRFVGDESFVDYIKSPISEIYYGNWKDEALEAYRRINSNNFEPFEDAERIGRFGDLFPFYDIYDIIHESEYSNLTSYKSAFNPSQAYTIKFDNPGDLFQGGKIPRGYKRACDFHFADSYHHIVKNNVTATSEFYNAISLTFPEGEPRPNIQSIVDEGDGLKTIEVVVDDNIASDFIRKKSIIDSNIDIDRLSRFKQYMDDLASAASSVRFFDNGKKVAKAGLDDASSPSNGSSDHVVKDVPIEYVVASSYLEDELKKMYTGNLTLLLDAKIRPHDTVYIHDDVNEMYGPVSVREVTHVFDAEAGAYSIVVPDLMTYALRTRPVIQSIYAANIVNASVKLSLIPGIGGALVGVPMMLLGTTPLFLAGASLAIGGQYAAYKISDAVLTGAYGNLLGREAGYFVPLWYRGMPFVAGLEGMRKDDYLTHTKDKVSRLGDVWSTVGAILDTRPILPDF